MDEFSVLEALEREFKTLSAAKRRSTLAQQARHIATVLDEEPAAHAVPALSKELRTCCELLFGTQALTREVSPAAGKKSGSVPGGDELDKLRTRKTA